MESQDGCGEKRTVSMIRRGANKLPLYVKRYGSKIYEKDPGMPSIAKPRLLKEDGCFID